jgi:hypothetical protein
MMILGLTEKRLQALNGRFAWPRKRWTSTEKNTAAEERLTQFVGRNSTHDRNSRAAGGAISFMMPLAEYQPG